MNKDINKYLDLKIALVYKNSYNKLGFRRENYYDTDLYKLYGKFLRLLYLESKSYYEIVEKITFYDLLKSNIEMSQKFKLTQQEQIKRNKKLLKEFERLFMF